MEHSVNTSVRSVIGSFVFLIISLPLGLLSFIVTVTGLSVGLGTMVIWLGLPILWLTLLCVRGMAEVERWSVRRLLGIPIGARQQPVLEQGFLRRFGRILRDPYTWTGALYMLLKMPLGVLNFSLAFPLALVSAALTVLPLVYLLNLCVNIFLFAHGIAAHSVLFPYALEIQGAFDPLMFARTLIGVPIGIICWVITRYVLTGLAICSGELARVLLGPGKAGAQPHQDRQYVVPALMQELRARRD